MEIPKKGDTVVQTATGKRFTVDEVFEAGGENLYRLTSPEGPHGISEAAFVREHEQAKATFEVVAP